MSYVRAWNYKKARQLTIATNLPITFERIHLYLEPILTSSFRIQFFTIY